MKSFLTMAALVLAAIWVWSKLSAKKPAGKAKAPDMTVPVDTGMFYGPYIDPKSGAYLEPGATEGSVGYPTQPVGPQ